MPDPQLCSEQEIRHLVERFYARVRADEQLGPIFATHVDDWDRHLARLADFWSSALRGTRRYRGLPMPAHAALPGLSDKLFRHWLALFRATTAELPNQALRARADQLAERIAQSLWHGYQLQHAPGLSDGNALPA